MDGKQQYTFTENELGDVFHGKTIIADTDITNLCASILKEEKNPTTGKRFYLHTPCHETTPDDSRIFEYPTIPIWQGMLNVCLPLGKYLIKVVNRSNKARSYGSVMYYNNGEAYREYYRQIGEQIPIDEKPTKIQTKIAVLEKQLKQHAQRIENLEKALKSNNTSSFLRPPPLPKKK